MAPRSKMPPLVLIGLMLGPALVIGATLWIVADLVPTCTVEEQERLTSPDGRFDLVIFSRECGQTEANTQAALVPAAEEIPFDAASFYSVAASAALEPAWIDADAIALTPSAGTAPLRADDTVAGVSVRYR